jgi:hypothetical protein
MDKDYSDSTPYVSICPNCSSDQLEFTGLQWYPEKVYDAQQAKPTVRDIHHPEQGALRAYTCYECNTTFVEPPTAAS